MLLRGTSNSYCRVPCWFPCISLTEACRVRAEQAPGLDSSLHPYSTEVLLACFSWISGVAEVARVIAARISARLLRGDEDASHE